MKSIRVKILSIVLLISFVSLGLTAAVGLVNMKNIQNDSTEALTERMKTNLSNVVSDKVKLANIQLDGYLNDVAYVAEYIHRLYNTPSAYLPREVDDVDASNAGQFVMQKCLHDESVKWEDVNEELGLLANAEDIIYPIIALSFESITCFNIGTESGFILAYDTQSDIKVGVTSYPYKESVWYKKAIEEKKVCFTDVYEDSFGRGLMITCVAPFYDSHDEFAGAVEMDILIENLYKNVIDIDLEGAQAVLVDNSGNVITMDGESYRLVDSDLVSSVVADKILASETSLDYNENGYCYAYAPIPNIGWKYCVLIPEEIMLNPVTAMNQKILISIIMFIAIFVVIMISVYVTVSIFSKSITKPISSLSKDADAISKGNLDHKAKIYHHDEIGELAVKFNNMAGSLKEYIKNLTAVTAEKERIGAELNVATQIQADMLPRIFPPFPDKKEMDVYATMQPAKEVGGDFYDFFLVDDDHIALVMADVSGKGVPAALFMVIAKTLIKNRTQMSDKISPAEILGDVNNILCEGNEAELFVTVWLCVIDLRTGKGIAANAGHEHPAIRRAGGEYELSIYRHSPAVATMEGMSFREHEFELNPGDSIYVYTDGVTEATNANNELFGNDRLLAALNKDPSLEPKEVLKSVNESITEFVGSAPQFDDITMMSFIYRGWSE